MLPARKSYILHPRSDCSAFKPLDQQLSTTMSIDKAEKAQRELDIQNVISFIRSQEANKINFAATASQFNVLESTLCARFNGLHQSHTEAHVGEQYITPSQEAILLAWCHHLGHMSIPLSRETVRAKAGEIKGDGTIPGNTWFKRYVRHNSDTLTFKKASGLDPKRAKNFNRATVEEHLRSFKEMLEKFGIPWENVYNMDEKGIQLGGGRKGSRRKFLYSRVQRERLRIKSDNLELVTVIEAVCCDGNAHIQPGFVAQAGDLGEWWTIPGVGRCVSVIYISL